MTKKELKAREFKHTNINIVILKKVLEEFPNTSDDEEDESESNDEKSFDNKAYANESLEDSITFNNDPASKNDFFHSSYQVNFTNSGTNEIITPSHKYNNLQPIVSPLNSNANQIIIPNSRMNNTFNINLENFFSKPVNPNYNQAAKSEYLLLKEKRKESEVDKDLGLVKPTARTKSLSLNVDEINEGDTNNFFYNNFKFHNDVVDLKKGDKNMNAPTSNNRKRMPSLGISPSSAFGKPSNFSYK